MDIKRRVSGRISPRSSTSAIVYGIEVSKVVLTALERTKTENDITFMTPLAVNATAILSTMRGIQEGEVDDEFAGIALDACGLAFILIHEYYQYRRAQNGIPERLKWGSDEIAEFLRDDVQPFVQKRISRGFWKRQLKHVADNDKILKIRERLRVWMFKLTEEDLSIHEKVEEIISEKMQSEEQKLQESFNNVSRSSEIGSTSEPTKTGSPRSSNKPLPQIIVSTDSRDEEERKGHKEIVVDSNYRTNTATRKGSSLSFEEEEHRKKRKEEERLAKKAERERWRRSEREFTQLPLHGGTTPAESETPSRPLSASGFHSLSESIRSAEGGSPSGSNYDKSTDYELAVRLQAQLAQEVEEEEEKKAGVGKPAELARSS